ncbi:hypothetical protein PEPS_18420 [Persicobacter psychrovividus]|uniref:Uncharacterized protein n=1 Tax=Persicobacter psychrovividus TaxID=387638 RepID=A0ABN6LE10_9BACT|nr:hypothetical protein PEPS_18420 [Persicobacter psychrovividus]
MNSSAKVLFYSVNSMTMIAKSLKKQQQKLNSLYGK